MTLKGPAIPWDEVKGIRDARRETKDAMRQPVKKVNKERQSAKAAREGFDPDYLDWIRKQPCIVSGKRTGEVVARGTTNGIHWQELAKVEAAHMKAGRTKGTDMTALPVETFYHTKGPESQHRMGIVSWAKHHKLDIPALIAAHRKRYALEMAEKVKSEVKR